MQAKTEFTEQQDLEVATNLFDGHLRQIGDLNLEACSDFVKSKTGFVVKFVTKPGIDIWVPQTSAPTSAPATRVPLRLLPRKCVGSATPLVTTIALTSATAGATVPGTGCCSGRPVAAWCEFCTDAYLKAKYNFPSWPKLPEGCFQPELRCDVVLCRDKDLRAVLQSWLHTRWRSPKQPSVVTTVDHSKPTPLQLVLRLRSRCSKTFC